MLRDLLSQFSMTSLSIVAMLLFLIMFVGAVLWVSRRSRTETYRQMANLPLEDDSDRRADR